jgi:hypothetical protein
MKNYNHIQYFIDSDGHIWHGPFCPGDNLHYKRVGHDVVSHSELPEYYVEITPLQAALLLEQKGKTPKINIEMRIPPVIHGPAIRLEKLRGQVTRMDPSPRNLAESIQALCGLVGELYHKLETDAKPGPSAFGCEAEKR